MNERLARKMPKKHGGEVRLSSNLTDCWGWKVVGDQKNDPTASPPEKMRMYRSTAGCVGMGCRCERVRKILPCQVSKSDPACIELVCRLRYSAVNDFVQYVRSARDG